MSLVQRLWPACGFAAITFLSAFLVFQVQPVISKAVLPWFGGCPAVWTTCMLFFQLLLFGGYAYTHALTTCCRPRWQGIIHLTLIAISLLVLPIIPSDSWKPTGNENPTGLILLMLAASVGLPYFLLSSTGPLLQAWFSRSCAGRSPYRLYALSNIGSLLALISYPFVVEPAWGTITQGAFWSIGFCAFAVMCGFLVFGLEKSNDQSTSVRSTLPPKSETDQAPSSARQSVWLLLPAFASIMLLATTNHVCQDVAIVPFLWIAPLSLYLLSFIICFDREKWYSRRWFSALTLVTIVGLHAASQWNGSLPLIPEVGLSLSAMFLVCMVCHGELVRAKPPAKYLTKFYLLTSAGGAVGGICVALICPMIFRTHFEMQLSLLGGIILAAIVGSLELRTFLVRPQRKLVAALVTLAMLLFVARVQTEQESASPITAVRNFYGTLCVTKSKTDQPMGTALIHGRIIHGFQFDHPHLGREPTTYYSHDSGVGLALRHLRSERSQRVGAVGLGCGTVAAYGRDGDYFRFYEINPAVIEIANRDFTFLKECQAHVDIQLGDARLSLERDRNQEFDLLILDAFSGDSIPAHLLTKEAFAIYRRHLKPDGVIAVHVSNRHLRLEPVVLRQAEHLRMHCVQVANQGKRERAILVSKWLLLTNNEQFLLQPKICAVAQSFGRVPGQEFPLWTDQYNNLFQILNTSF